MPIAQLRNVDFGRNRSDQNDVGYTVLDFAGNTVTTRTTAGVYQLVSGSGLYAAYVEFPDDFRGQIVWDVPAFTGSNNIVYAQSFATEQYNVEENDPKAGETYDMVSSVTGTIQSIYDINYGRWVVNKNTNQMTFYTPDGLTVVAAFNLYDDNGNPTFDGVFERRRV